VTATKDVDYFSFPPSLPFSFFFHIFTGHRATSRLQRILDERDSRSRQSDVLNIAIIDDEERGEEEKRPGYHRHLMNAKDDDRVVQDPDGRPSAISDDAEDGRTARVTGEGREGGIGA